MCGTISLLVEPIRITKQPTMGRVVHGASCPWASCLWGELAVGQLSMGRTFCEGELSVGRTVHGANCPWGELSVGRVVVGRIVEGRVLREPLYIPTAILSVNYTVLSAVIVSACIAGQAHDR
jgi:hypothetical protein